MTTTMDAPWRLSAACLEHDPQLWFPGVGDEGAEARQICHTCPVKRECLEWSLAVEGSIGRTDRHGIYGGKSPRARAAIANRNAARRTS